MKPCKLPVIAALMFLFVSTAAYGQGTGKTATEPSRFSPELVEFLKAASDGYALGGKTTMAKFDPAVLVRVAESKDPSLRELGRRACYLAYLQMLVQGQKAPADIDRIAKSIDSKPAVSKLEAALQTRLPSEEVRQVITGIQALDAVAKDDWRKIEKILFTDAQNEANLATAVRVVGQEESFVLKQLLRKQVGDATKPLTAKEPFRVRLEKGKGGEVSMVATNQSKSTLHNALIMTRIVNDPQLVQKLADAEYLTRVVLLKKLGTSELGKTIGASEKNLKSATAAIHLEKALLSKESGTMIFVPTIAAQESVRIRLYPPRYADVVQSVGFACWCDELTIPALDVDPEAMVGATPLILDKRGIAALSDKFTKTDPVDMDENPLRQRQRCRVYSMNMIAGRLYIIQGAAVPVPLGKVQNSVPHLRVENNKGQIMLDERLGGTVPGGTNVLQFRPQVSGEYRIVCTASFGQLGEFQLTVQRK